LTIPTPGKIATTSEALPRMADAELETLILELGPWMATAYNRGVPDATRAAYAALAKQANSERARRQAAGRWNPGRAGELFEAGAGTRDAEQRRLAETAGGDPAARVEEPGFFGGLLDRVTGAYSRAGDAALSVIGFGAEQTVGSRVAGFARLAVGLIAVAVVLYALYRLGRFGVGLQVGAIKRTTAYADRAASAYLGGGARAALPPGVE